MNTKFFVIFIISLLAVIGINVYRATIEKQRLKATIETREIMKHLPEKYFRFYP